MFKRPAMGTKLPYSATKVAALREKHDKGYVVGLREVAGEVPRLDVDVLLSRDPKCFNLFLLALHDLQYDLKFADSPMSFFEIAGIHGVPKRAWNGIDHERKTGRQKGNPLGYCEHSSFKFPTWHRPYLAMLEVRSKHNEMCCFGV